MKKEKIRFAYIQGRWKCRIVEEIGNAFRYVPLEGFAKGEKGKTFTASKDLFTKNYLPVQDH